MGCIDKKISELSQLTTPAVNDLLAIVDVSIAGFETRYITVADLVTGGIVAPADAQYVTLALDADLTNERVLTGTANQVIVTDGGAGGPVTLSTPQDINVGSTPTFGGLTINGNITVTGTVDGVDLAGLSAAQFVTMAASGFLANERILTGTANQVIVTDGGAGGNVTLSLPQDIHLLATPQFDGMTLTGQLLIDGAVDEIQARIQAVAGQTANIVTVENSAGNVLSGFGSSGRIFSNLNTSILNFFAIGSGNTTTTGDDNIGIGSESMTGLTTGSDNIAMCFRALRQVTTGSYNIALGKYALETGEPSYNVAIGYTSLRYCVGQRNFGLGFQAGLNLTNANDNIAVGQGSCYQNQTGTANVYLGTRAGYGVAGNSHNYNNFIGYESGYKITTGGYNCCLGSSTGYTTANGQRNVYIGQATGYFGTSASDNVAIGYVSLYQNVTGGKNVCIGYQAARGSVAANSFANSVMVGYNAGTNITTGGNNILLGYQAGDLLTTGASNIIIGYNADPTANNVSSQLNIGDLIYGDLTANKRAGVNVTPPSLAATFHIDQSSNTGAVPVLLLDQADIDVVLMKVIGTAEAASADRTLVAASDFGTPGALVGWVQINVQDDGNRIPDSDYWMPFYQTPT